MRHFLLAIVLPVLFGHVLLTALNCQLVLDGVSLRARSRLNYFDSALHNKSLARLRALRKFTLRGLLKILLDLGQVLRAHHRLVVALANVLVASQGTAQALALLGQQIHRAGHQLFVGERVRYRLDKGLARAFQRGHYRNDL